MNDPAPMKTWLTEPLETPVAQALERVRRADDVAHVAVMPDVHLAKEVCVGTVIATRRLIYPGAVGGDIGCGMLAIPFDAAASDLSDPTLAGTVLRALSEQILASRRHRDRTLPMPADALVDALSDPSLVGVARDVATLQLGTLGGGNHFVELQSDTENRLWLMIHSGSRAMGQAIRSLHLSRGFVTSTKLIALDAETPAGQAYLHDMQWARRYARANREAMGQVVSDVLRERMRANAIESEAIRCDHNHVALESHFGQSLYIHRKGAMPAEKDLAGVVPGSMGTLSYHVVGKGCENALKSSAHGAGRRHSRTAARDAFRASDLRHQMKSVWFDPRLADQLREECPKAYKDVRAVLAAEEELVERVRTLRPVLVYKSA